MSGRTTAQRCTRLASRQHVITAHAVPRCRSERQVPCLLSGSNHVR